MNAFKTEGPYEFRSGFLFAIGSNRYCCADCLEAVSKKLLKKSAEGAICPVCMEAELDDTEMVFGDGYEGD